VICGFGRTGEWFGSDYYDLKPDLMTIAKGLTSGYIPMGGVIVRDKVAGAQRRRRFQPRLHLLRPPGGGRGGLENLRILRDEKIIEQARTETAPYLQKRLRELQDHPLVGEVRGLGLLGAIELVKTRPPAAVTKARAWA
jgi:putrescine aminotransferase